MFSGIREPGFCLECGTILPLPKEHGNIECYLCKSSFGIEVFGASDTEQVYTVQLNTYTKNKPADSGEKTEDGPVVERKCSNCGNERMSYATLQLRSADEGQTVFFTCTKCHFKETENS